MATMKVPCPIHAGQHELETYLDGGWRILKCGSRVILATSAHKTKSQIIAILEKLY